MTDQTLDTFVHGLTEEVALDAQDRLRANGIEARAFKRIGEHTWSLRASAYGSVVQNAITIAELSR